MKTYRKISGLTRFVFFPALFICFVTTLSAQNKPFELFETAVRNERGGFAGNKERLSTVFNEERLRLGDQFEFELEKYVGKDREKLYWIGLFLTAPSYLHGNTALPNVSYKLFKSAISILETRSDEESLGRLVTIKRRLALIAKELGRRAEALELKESAEKLWSTHTDIGIFAATFNPVDNCLYLKLDEDKPVCGDERPSEKIVAAGILNYRTTSQPRPLYPDEIRMKNIGGRVEIKVLVGFDGSPIFAVALSGPEELREVSRQAALAAKFSPMKLNGDPVKMSGVLIYTFNPK